MAAGSQSKSVPLFIYTSNFIGNFIALFLALMTEAGVRLATYSVEFKPHRAEAVTGGNSH